MSSAWYASVDAEAMSEPGANFTLHTTHAITGVNREAWTNSRLFNSTKDDVPVVFAATVTQAGRPSSGSTRSIKAFTDGETGDTFVNLTTPGRWVWTLTAVDEAGARATVGTHAFSVLPDDTWNATNGPSGKGCEHGRPIDAVLFDRRFTCDCADTKYTGANCDDNTLTSTFRPSRRRSSDWRGRCWLCRRVCVSQAPKRQNVRKAEALRELQRR